MSGWIGTLANMQEFLWPVSLKESIPNRYSVQESPSVLWVFANSSSTNSRREWSVEVESTNADSAVIRAHAQGAYGNGPFYFVPETAALTNVLTPAQSLLKGIANGGHLQTVEGTSDTSLIGGASTTLADKVPVLPNEPVTVSVQAAGATKLTITFKTASGSTIASKEAVANGMLMQKISTTIPKTPATARYITITASGYTALACPQVVWYEESVPWDIGGGASSVIVMGADSAFHQFETDTKDFWRTTSFSVKEVG